MRSRDFWASSIIKPIWMEGSVAECVKSGFRNWISCAVAGVTHRRWSRHAAIRQRKPIKINREATKASGISERTERAEVIHARNVVREVNLRETSTSWAVFEVVRWRKERRCWAFVSGSLSWNRIGWKLGQLSVSRLMTRGKRITLMEHNRVLCYPVCPALASPDTLHRLI